MSSLLSLLLILLPQLLNLLLRLLKLLMELWVPARWPSSCASTCGVSELARYPPQPKTTPLLFLPPAAFTNALFSCWTDSGLSGCDVWVSCSTVCWYLAC